MTPTPSLLAGRRAFLTGPGRGIGAATARGFCAAGAAVAVTDVDADAAAAVANALCAEGIVAYARGLDVTDEAAVIDALADAAARLGGLDSYVSGIALVTDGGELSG